MEVNNNPALQLLIDLALEIVPECVDGKQPCLLYTSQCDHETQESFTENLLATFVGVLKEDTELHTRSGWVIAFKHSNSREELDEFSRLIREKYHVVENWHEMSIKKHKLPRLLNYLDEMVKQQVQH